MNELRHLIMASDVAGAILTRPLNSANSESCGALCPIYQQCACSSARSDRPTVDTPRCCRTEIQHALTALKARIKSDKTRVQLAGLEVGIPNSPLRLDSYLLSAAPFCCL